MSKAATLFKSFHERNPAPSEIVSIEQNGAEECLAVGEVYGIMYKVKGTPEPYLHKFGTTKRPKLFVSADGKQIYIVKGQYKFTYRGFIG